MATIAENLQLLVDSSKAIEQTIISNGGEVTGGFISYADDISEMFGKDLSKRDIYDNRVPQTTANCYIVKETGTYKFPCVYGNAISKGAVNAIAYTKNSGSYSHNFVNYKGEQITSPWIAEDTGETISSVQLSIADTEGIFANIKIKGDYIVFNVNQVPATGANGVISIKNNSGTIMWNWHIWVWSDDLTPVEITNATGFVYKILPVNLASKWESSKNNPR
jgi:hypothetical protein